MIEQNDCIPNPKWHQDDHPIGVRTKGPVHLQTYIQGQPKDGDGSSNKDSKNFGSIDNGGGSEVVSQFLRIQRKGLVNPFHASFTDGIVCFSLMRV
jgi:hypothetical protein